jgi:arylsulfatase A-like enzyme
MATAAASERERLHQPQGWPSNKMIHRSLLGFGLALALPVVVPAVTIAPGDVSAALGPDFFFDDAATGGADNSATVFVRDIAGYWNSNEIVTLKGLGWASKSGGTVATNVTVTFTDPGPDLVHDTGDDVVVGTRTDALVFVANTEYAWPFDSNVVFTAQSGSLRISIAGYSNGAPAVIYRKTTSGTSQDAVKLSLAGTASGEPPLATAATAAAAGYWDSINWNTGSGLITGGIPDPVTVVIGSGREVIYRGAPANEIVAGLNLGDNGDGYLVISNGQLTITGDLKTGLTSSANDGFLRVYGGTLQVNGSAHLGRFTEAADGTLEVGGGAVAIGGDLNLGAYLSGGSLLRFKNPGSSPAIQVGGVLRLHRTVLGLTFDTNYVHNPGATIELVEYASREGQFANHRQAEEFNSGPNRFRIHYDVPAGGGRSKITLTSLTNWPNSGGPNIILLFADDQGSADLRLYGDSRYPMPRLESLAAQGVKFTDAYVTAGVCHPARCGLLTGRYQQRFGVEDNLGGPSYNGLPNSQRTVPQLMQGLGYRTYGIAKWHLGTTVNYHPLQRGFDAWYGINAGSRSFWDATGEDNQFQDNEVLRPEDEGDYVTDRVGNACTNFIARHLALYGTNQPFFIYAAFTAVHAPMDIDTPPAPKPADPRYARLWNEFGLTNSSYGPPEIVFGGSTAATTQKNRYDLAAMTLALDENIGKIVDLINASGLGTNTLIVYLNDNGGAGWNATFGGNFSYNRPLRGYKGSSMTEGSIRIPAVAAWPGAIPAGQTNSTPVNSLDFMATFVNAGQNVPAAARNGLEGLDLMPMLRFGTPLPTDRVLCWRAGGSSSGGSAARMGQWKLLGDDSAGTFRLYNLASDIGESTDVSAANPAVFSEMLERFHGWDAGNIEPLYGGTTMQVDAALERSGITGGYRIVNRTTTPAYLTATLRDPIYLSSDFSLGFYLRAAESNAAAGAGLWFVLGDSATRANLIRAGVDFATGQLFLSEGRGGASSTAPLAALPQTSEAGVLRYTAASRQLKFEYGGTNVTVTLPGNYGALAVSGCGAAAMEGEVSQGFQPATSGPAVQTYQVRAANSKFSFRARYTGDTVAGPAVNVASQLTGPFAGGEQVLIESLGGGVYQFTAPLQSAAASQFFRVNFNQP